ncbi:MAG TPA: hypothetical protein VL832_19455 [Puia sp.]|nr:hypothetical protein [Puia sp.]
MAIRKQKKTAARNNKSTRRYQSRRRKFSLTAVNSRRPAENGNDLSDFEGKKDHTFLIEIGRQAATNAVNENKAMDIPITFLKDGWVIRRMPNGEIVKVAKLDPQTKTIRQRKFTKGTVLHVKKTD